jgi:2'-5' RNA ligase
MRLFIAIQFEQTIHEALTDFQEELKSRGVRGNYTRTENLHLTLAFIGEYGNPDEVLDAMEEAEFKPIEISLDGVGNFGDLFWVGLKDNPELTAYVKRLRRALSDADIPFDKKKFSPHITLVRRGQLLREDAIAITKTPEGAMHASRVALMRYDLEKAVMIYTEVGAVEAE